MILLGFVLAVTESPSNNKNNLAGHVFINAYIVVMMNVFAFSGITYLYNSTDILNY